MDDSSPKMITIKLKDSIEENLKLSGEIRERPINLAISAMISPRETYIYYEKLVEFISQKLNRKIQFKQRRTYEEVNQLLKTGEVDIAFICSGAYVSAKPEGYMEILAVPVVNGEPYYRAYIIVHKKSSFESLKDLKGKRFAYTDPLSNTGYFYVLRRIKEMGYTADSFFRKTFFTFAHDYSIQSVARKIVDGASIDGLIYQYLEKKNPKMIQEVRIIEKSEPFGIPPVVVPRLLNPKIKKKLQLILIHLHEDPKGKTILNQLNIDRFILPDNVDYKSVYKNMRMALE
jgi:phosphonate transport system substrate-binding protein